MLTKKTVSRAAIILACAAALTFVAAQYPWETDNSGAVSGGEEAPAPEAGPYDIGAYTPPEDGAVSDAPAAAEEAPAASAKEPRARRERAARGSSGSSAFSGPQKSCPVCTSVRLKGNLYVEHSGKKIHVCSAACIGRVRRNPAAFMAKLEKRGEQLAGL